MPRGRVKAIVSTAEFKIASNKGRAPVCRGDRKNHTIAPGDTHLLIKEGMNEKRYCIQCARAVLEKGAARIAELFAELEATEGKDRLTPSD